MDKAPNNFCCLIWTWKSLTNLNVHPSNPWHGQLWQYPSFPSKTIFVMCISIMLFVSLSCSLQTSFFPFRFCHNSCWRRVDGSLCASEEWQNGIELVSAIAKRQKLHHAHLYTCMTVPVWFKHILGHTNIRIASSFTIYYFINLKSPIYVLQKFLSFIYKISHGSLIRHEKTCTYISYENIP